jgi:hypothetical protein
VSAKLCRRENKDRINISPAHRTDHSLVVAPLRGAVTVRDVGDQTRKSPSALAQHHAQDRVARRVRGRMPVLTDDALELELLQ